MKNVKGQTRSIYLSCWSTESQYTTYHGRPDLCD